MHTEPGGALFRSDDASSTNSVTLLFEGRMITAPAGVSVAAALLLNGAGHFRSTPVSASPRAAYCMMGVCFECLVEVDGVPGLQGCQTAVREGMVVRRQQGAPALKLRTADDRAQSVHGH